MIIQFPFYAFNSFFEIFIHVYNAFCLLSFLPSSSSSHPLLPNLHLSSHKSISTLMPFCLVLWPTDFNWDQQCGYGFGVVHWNLVCSPLWVSYTTEDKYRPSSGIHLLLIAQSVSPFPKVRAAVDRPNCVPAQCKQLQVLWDHVSSAVFKEMYFYITGGGGGISEKKDAWPCFNYLYF